MGVVDSLSSMSMAMPDNKDACRDFAVIKIFLPMVVFKSRGMGSNGVDDEFELMCKVVSFRRILPYNVGYSVVVDMLSEGGFSFITV
jgi:hypothetical protein